MTNHIDTDLVTEALELLHEVTDKLRESGLLEDPRFRAYHACQLQGSEGGWLGGPFLVDAIEEWTHASSECPECGGWTGVGDLPEDDYDECDCA